jgi:hypothetical protein
MNTSKIMQSSSVSYNEPFKTMKFLFQPGWPGAIVLEH